MAAGAQPESFAVELEPSSSACAGAATAFLLRRIASRAGTYAPGIQERLFFQLQRDETGGDIDRVWRWFSGTATELHRLGYCLSMRRVAFRTPGILRWVEHGAGFRGAVLTTDPVQLRPGGDAGARHAVAVTVREGKRGKDELVLVDPWPGRADAEKPPETLEAAHRMRKYGALVVYWSGWS